MGTEWVASVHLLVMKIGRENFHFSATKLWLIKNFPLYTGRCGPTARKIVNYRTSDCRRVFTWPPNGSKISQPSIHVSSISQSPRRVNKTLLIHVSIRLKTLQISNLWIRRMGTGKMVNLTTEILKQLGPFSTVCGYSLWRYSRCRLDLEMWGSS